MLLSQNILKSPKDMYFMFNLALSAVAAATGALSVAERSYPTSEARSGGREEQPHIHGVVAARAQEGLEELFHVQGQEGGR